MTDEYKTNTKAQRTQLRKVLGSRRGAKAEVARRAGVKMQTVSSYLLYGMVSANVQRHCEQVVAEIKEGTWRR